MDHLNGAVSKGGASRSPEQRSGWARRRVLVTGATGFIGSRLTRLLGQAGAEVWAGVFPDGATSGESRLPAQARRLSLDVRDSDSVSRVVAQSNPEVVFHLAAVGVADVSVDAYDALQVNTGGTIRLLEAMRQRSVARVVLVGTSYEYGARQAREGLDPFSFYAASKAAAWAFARVYWRTLRIPIVVARPAQVYGPGQPPHTLVCAAVRAALAGADFPMTRGEQRRDFVFTDDVAQGLLALATATGVDGTSLDLGTGATHTVREVVEAIWEITGAQGEILIGELPTRPGEAAEVVVDAQTTAKLTGWQASVSLREGLRRVVEAVRQESATGETEA